MGNSNCGESTGPVHRIDDGILAHHLQTKIRLMAALSHDCRRVVEERSHLRERLAEMKAERRRISIDLRGGGVSNEQRLKTIVVNAASGSDISSRTTTVMDAYKSDRICAVCGEEAKREKNYPCRVCTRIYHPGCLKTCGECRSEDMKAASRALTNEGWSCFNCTNLGSLLTEEEIEHIIQAFDEFDRDHDNTVSWDEYLVSRCHREARRVSEISETAMRLEFQMADQNGDQSLDWWEFLNLAAQHALCTRSQDQLVDLLTDKEVSRVHAMFSQLDTDNDGVVTGLEARRAVRKWCRDITANMPPDQIAKMSSTIDSHVEVRAQMLVDGGDEQKDMITLPDFLAQQALYILCSRPNMGQTFIDKMQHKNDVTRHAQATAALNKEHK